MYIDKTSIEVIGDKWIEGKEKPEKDSVLNSFNFDDGIHAKDLAKFLEHLQEDHRHKFCGDVECHITIRQRDY
jgi:hypothetical protein